MKSAHRGGERAVRRVLALALRGALPVEVVAAPSAAFSAARSSAASGAGEAEAGRAHQGLLRPGRDHVQAPLVLPTGERPRPRRRRPRSARRAACATSSQRADVVDDPVEVSDSVVKTVPAPSLSASTGRGPPARPACPHSTSRCVSAPYASHSSAQRCRTCRTRRPPPSARPDQVRDRGLHGAGARRREAQHLVAGLEDPLEPLERARVDLHEGRRTVVQDRLGLDTEDLPGGIGVGATRRCRVVEFTSAIGTATIANGGRFQLPRSDRLRRRLRCGGPRFPADSSAFISRSSRTAPGGGPVGHQAGRSACGSGSGRSRPRTRESGSPPHRGRRARPRGPPPRPGARRSRIAARADERRDQELRGLPLARSRSARPRSPRRRCARRRHHHHARPLIMARMSPSECSRRSAPVLSSFFGEQVDEASSSSS